MFLDFPKEALEWIFPYKSEADINISELAVIEFISTIYRKFREHEIGLDVLNILTEKFQNDIEYRYEVLNFSSLVFREYKR